MLHERQGRVYENAVRRGDDVQHALERIKVRQRLAAGEHKIALRRYFMHRAYAAADLLRAEAVRACIFLLIYAERTVIFAIVGHEYGNCRSAVSCYIGIAHQSLNLSRRCAFGQSAGRLFFQSIIYHFWEAVSISLPKVKNLTYF